MEGSDDEGFRYSVSVRITGQIMVIAIVGLFVVAAFVLFLHLYAKWFWWRIEQQPGTPPRRSRGLLDLPAGQDPAFNVRTGLNRAILRSIPVGTFNPEDFKDGLECAVCLSELEQGEKTRLLPKCNHGFHVDCIDMWFLSHSTCPLCRNPVVEDQLDSRDTESVEGIDNQNSEENFVSGFSTETPNFPTNVLFWGNETQVSTGGACLEKGTTSSSSSSSSQSYSTDLVIDIPVSMSGHLSVLSPTGCPEEESKSPVPTRLRSLKRLLSREKRANPSSPSSSFDVVREYRFEGKADLVARRYDCISA